MDNQPDKVGLETTVPQRIGYVFGWIGNALGGLLVLTAIITLIYQIISVNADVRRLTDEARVLANQIRKIAPTKSGSRLRLIPVDESELIKYRATVELLVQKDREIDQTKSEMNAQVVAIALLWLAPGFVIIILGQFLRYIFSGSFSRIPNGWLRKPK